MTSARRSLTEHNSGQSLQGNGSILPPSAKSMRVLHQNLYRNSFVLRMMGQAKMIRRCFPIKQNYQCLRGTPERQNFNASQTQPDKSVYSRTNCTGSPGQPTRSLGIHVLCSHPASQTLLEHTPHPSSTLKRWGSWALHTDSPRLKSSSSKLPLS